MRNGPWMNHGWRSMRCEIRVVFQRNASEKCEFLLNGKQCELEVNISRTVFVNIYLFIKTSQQKEFVEQVISNRC